MIRTHNCGQLRKEHVPEKVELAGWIDARRDHGEIIFMDLRDKHGRTQIVFDPERSRSAHDVAHTLSSEWCVKIIGTVSARPEGTVNPSIPTGEIEVEVSEVEVLSESLTPPFEIKDDIKVSEELRLKHRYLDLRRPVMQRMLQMKHRFYKSLSDILDNEGFVNVETPQLTKSTPEGARDFLVPSRVHKGSFYALPQSPQIFKQILMVAGVERYYQIVKCFRDEDLRADRQPEFTQLDMEMSFVDRDDVLEVTEKLIKGVFDEITDKVLKVPFDRLSYADALRLYGTDKPDTRFDLLLEDLTEDVRSSSFKVFSQAVSSGGRVKALRAPGFGKISRARIDKLTESAKESGAKGLAYFKVTASALESPISKFFKEEELQLFKERLAAEDGDMIFMVADQQNIANEVLGNLRLEVGREKRLFQEDEISFLWVVDFPLFKYNEDEARWVSEHHPFTGFYEEDVSKLEGDDLGGIRSKSYDLVLNGNEIASGSIRIFRRDQQRKIFEVLGLSAEEINEKFGFLMEAFNYAPPPHGGIAFGLDRMLAILSGTSSIREVIPFPKTQKGTCLLSDAPSRIEHGQLAELGLELKEESA